jgi:hypothetical protein
VKPLPRDVEAALRSAGWDPEVRDSPANRARARRWTLDVAAYATPDGRTHTVVPAAVAVFATYGGVELPPSDEGRDIAPAGFRLEPTRALASVATLIAFGGVVHSRLTPIGDEGAGTGLLAIDGDGRVFVLDHTGEWFLGDTIEDALTTLVLGLQPPRVRRDGTW